VVSFLGSQERQPRLIAKAAAAVDADRARAEPAAIKLVTDLQVQGPKSHG
jgi:hypothetical protein